MKKTIKIKPKKMSITISSEYEKDFYKWTQAQADLLRKKDFSHLDLENVLEEIESLGNSDKRSLKSYTVVLLTHLLKQRYQPDFDCNSWRSSINNSRNQINYLLEDSPSLENELKKIFKDAYKKAKESAAYETGYKVSSFPKECPWKIEEILPT